MHEVILWPSAGAVEAGVGIVMCSYNMVNQTQSCQNSKTINGLLKEELEVQGFMLSDWAALINGVQPTLAGTDMNMPGFMAYGQPTESNPDNTQFSWWGSALIESVNNGSVPQARVDDMVTRTMAAFFTLGQEKNYPAINFDYNTQNTLVDGQPLNQHVDVKADHFKPIRTIGAASAVLLKNTNGALPLNAQKINNGNTDHGYSQDTFTMGRGFGTVELPYLIDPLSAIQTFMRTNNPTTPADTCLVFTNADSGEGYITVDGNSGDRMNIRLWHSGEALIQRTASSCVNTIVVMHIVGPVTVETWIDHRTLWLL
ncbi:glycoside hydrolase family 3 protein [Sphaerobolus stellatus SS14]|uniref:beta-glucosidase n=1 Tax=Sphaerobolus stellatus (strain SS14) TaxID=990650 RepID=A0A0C9UXP9_SPHS4|nr:glycoside hydrolase family 3 protein [Sphaerobolus stellatus SS14]